MTSTAPTGTSALARQSSYHRQQAHLATCRGDVGEAALWNALADEIDSYLSQDQEATADLFGERGG